MHVKRIVRINYIMHTHYNIIIIVQYYNNVYTLTIRIEIRKAPMAVLYYL